MGFWTFGNQPADVELASRVVTARARDLVTVRGKLILHFREPQTKAAADAAADACAELAARIMRDAPNHVGLIGGESGVISELVSRLPPDLAATRTVELHSLHVVGSSASSPAVRRPSSGAIAAVVPPAQGVALTPTPSGGLPSTPSLGTPRVPSAPPTVSPIPGMPIVEVGRSNQPRRISSSRMRAPTTVSVPPGSGPAQIGTALVPVVRDAATRILVGILRAHDLLVIRRLPLDDSPDMMAALVPTSEAPPGGFEASRAQELSRWQTALGPDVYRRLSVEAAVFAVYLSYAAMLEARVPSELALASIEVACESGYAREDSPLPQLARYLHAVRPELVNDLARHMIGMLGGGGDQNATMARAVAPLLEAVREEMGFTATVIRNATATG